MKLLKIKKKLTYYLLAGTALTFSSCAELQQIANQAQQERSTSSTNTSASTTVTTSEANSAIKQALSNGLNNSIKSLSAKDGFLGNAAVKVLMPPEVQKVESTLRSIGMGKVCDQFITSMNRAAENAVKEAAPVFVNALSGMTVQDAINILLSSRQDAATTFFKNNTSVELTTRFLPIVQSALGKNNVNTYWNQLATAYNNLPVQGKVESDLDSYVTQKAIDGLFFKIADEEKKIRNNLPGSRTTAGLQKVFGWVDQQKKN